MKYDNKTIFDGTNEILQKHFNGFSNVGTKKAFKHEMAFVAKSLGGLFAAFEFQNKDEIMLSVATTMRRLIIASNFTEEKINLYFYEQTFELNQPDMSDVFSMFRQAYDLYDNGDDCYGILESLNHDLQMFALQNGFNIADALVKFPAAM